MNNGSEKFEPNVIVRGPNLHRVLITGGSGFVATNLADRLLSAGERVKTFLVPIPMTTFIFIRHAAHDLLGRVLTGRAPGLHLNAGGRIQAERLADRLSKLPIGAIYSGPLERAQETAGPLSKRLSLERCLSPAFDEVDFGAWTSLTFTALEQRPDWKIWNESRDRATPPEGESIQAVQERVAIEMNFLVQRHPEEIITIVSHGEVIKSVMMYFLGIPIKSHARLEISPGSLTVMTLIRGVAQVKAISDTGHLSD
jgi:broad specificity phosphatase PhoE